MVSDCSVAMQHCVGGMAVGGSSAATLCCTRHWVAGRRVWVVAPPVWPLSVFVFFSTLNTLRAVLLLVPLTFWGCSAVDPGRAVNPPGSGRLCEAVRRLAQGVRCTLPLLLGALLACAGGKCLWLGSPCVCVLDKSNTCRHPVLLRVFCSCTVRGCGTCVCGGVCLAGSLCVRVHTRVWVVLTSLLRGHYGTAVLYHTVRRPL
jgi:hypothetical protein